MNASRFATLLGILAIAFWATSVAYTRILAETFGLYTNTWMGYSI